MYVSIYNSQQQKVRDYLRVRLRYRDTVAANFITAPLRVYVLHLLPGNGTPPASFSSEAYRGVASWTSPYEDGVEKTLSDWLPILMTK